MDSTFGFQNTCEKLNLTSTTDFTDALLCIVFLGHPVYFIGVEIELKVLLTLASHVRKSKTMVRHFYNLHSKVFLKTYIYICQRMLLEYHLCLKIALNTSCKINVYRQYCLCPAYKKSAPGSVQ